MALQESDSDEHLLKLKSNKIFIFHDLGRHFHFNDNNWK